MSGILTAQLKRYVVAPALEAIGLGGEAAVNLLTGTALVESQAMYLRQVGGPALGMWQMEPATHDDCWRNFLDYEARRPLAVRIAGMAASDMPRVEQLVCNLRYACVMARVKYYRVAQALPEASDAAAMSAYHKRWYNTFAGAADIQRNLPLFQCAIAA